MGDTTTPTPTPTSTPEPAPTDAPEPAPEAPTEKSLDLCACQASYLPHRHTETGIEDAK